MATGSSDEPDDSGALGASLHRLRSTLARLRAELDLAELDAVPPGPGAFAALEDALSRLTEVELVALGGVSRVHVLDDDARLAELVAIQLRRRGFEASSSADLNGLRADLRSGDRLLVDYGLIAGQPVALVEQLLAATRAIVVSGSASRASRERALALGAAAYLVKPIEMDELVALLREPSSP